MLVDYLKEKGILDLLKFVEIASKDIDIIIIGSGPEESKVREVAELFSNLHFLGYQSKRNTIKLIRGSDMMIQPSIMEGGTSSSLLESMACKTSIIATSVDGNKETIVHMSTAYVVSANNPIEINNAVNYLFDNPEKPKYSILFMLFTLAALGLPGTSGFIGEFLVLMGAFKDNFLVAVIASLGVILGAAYMLWLYRRVVFGNLVNKDLLKIPDLDNSEKFILWSLAIPVLFFGFYPEPLN